MMTMKQLRLERYVCLWCEFVLVFVFVKFGENK
jgi:hypothetical protein